MLSLFTWQSPDASANREMSFQMVCTGYGNRGRPLDKRWTRFAVDRVDKPWLISLTSVWPISQSIGDRVNQLR